MLARSSEKLISAIMLQNLVNTVPPMLHLTRAVRSQIATFHFIFFHCFNRCTGTGQYYCHSDYRLGHGNHSPSLGGTASSNAMNFLFEVQLFGAGALYLTSNNCSTIFHCAEQREAFLFVDGYNVTISSVICCWHYDSITSS